LNGARVGRWVIAASGEVELHYDPNWIASPTAHPLSLSLPLSPDGAPLKGEPVERYFDNLLPDNAETRRRLHIKCETDSTSTFDLLEAIGRDCIGAVQILPEEDAPSSAQNIEVEALNEAEVERQLLAAISPVSTLQSEEQLRVALAGAQEKTALTWHQNTWCRPRGQAPTTHIFKFPMGVVGGRRLDMSTSLENEWLCSRLLAEYGVPIAPCEILQFGETRALVVTRFDRVLPDKKYWLQALSGAGDRA
jgi:serine/threonine-protein kinase HipA